MARVAFPLVLQSPSTGSAIQGATATITQHTPGGSVGGGAAASIYTSETTAVSTGSNQIVTDSTGRWTQGSGAGFAQYWLPQGTYDIVVSGAGLTSYTITREFLSAGQSDMVELAGELKFWPGVALPTGFAWANGQALSRTTYSAMFTNLAIQTTGTLSTVSLTISAIPAGAIAQLQQITNSQISQLAIPISGPGIQAGTVITAYSVGTSTITISQLPTASGAGVALVIAPHGVGDGSTTFNVPNMTGKLPLGQSAQGNPGSILAQTGGALGHTHSIPALAIPGLAIPGLAIPGLSVPAVPVATFSHTHSLSSAGGAAVQIQGNGITVGGASGVGFSVSQLGNASGWNNSSPGGTHSAVALVGNTDAGGGNFAGGQTYATTTGGGTTGGGTTGGGSTGTGTTGAGDPPYLACPWIVRHGVQ